MWHRIDLGENFAYTGAALQQRLGDFMITAATRVNPLPGLDIFSSPVNPYHSEELYLAPGTVEFLRPVFALAGLSDLAECEKPRDPGQLALFFHYGEHDPFEKHFGQEASGLSKA